MTPLTPDFRSAPGFLLAGLRRHHPFAGMHESIPRQWRDFLALGDVVGQVGRRRYGAICGAGEGSVEYLTGVEVASLEVVPAGLGRMRVPPQEYAVFTHRGPAATLWDAWNRIMTEWMPESGYRDAPTPAFERYPEDYDPTRADAEVEIWFSVVKEGSPEAHRSMKWATFRPEPNDTDNGAAMNTEVAAAAPGARASKGWTVALWIVQVLLALGIAMSGFMKATMPMADLVAMMAWAGDLPAALIRFIGVAEMAGALGLILPAATRIKPGLTTLAAAGLLVIMVLAIIFHIARGETGMLTSPAIFGALAAFVAWGRARKAPIRPRR